MARLADAALALALLASGSSCTSTPGVSRGVTHPSPRAWSFASVDRPLSREVVRDGDAWRISADRGSSSACWIWPVIQASSPAVLSRGNHARVVVSVHSEHAKGRRAIGLQVVSII